LEHPPLTTIDPGHRTPTFTRDKAQLSLLDRTLA
jgi:hypothetical protein